MSDQFQLDPDQLQASINSLTDLGDKYAAAVQKWRDTLRQHDGCWGNDDIGKTFGQNFTTQEQNADSNVDTGTEWFGDGTDQLKQAMNALEATDSDNASQVNSSGETYPLDPYGGGPGPVLDPSAGETSAYPLQYETPQHPLLPAEPLTAVQPRADEPLLPAQPAQPRQYGSPEGPEGPVVADQPRQHTEQPREDVAGEQAEQPLTPAQPVKKGNPDYPGTQLPGIVALGSVEQAG
jgi:hypothetical protein